MTDRDETRRNPGEPGNPEDPELNDPTLRKAMHDVREAPRPEAPTGVLADLLQAQAAFAAATNADPAAGPSAGPGRSKPAPHAGRSARRPGIAIAAVMAAAMLFSSGFWAGRHSAPNLAASTLTQSTASTLCDSLPAPPYVPFRSVATSVP